MNGLTCVATGKHGAEYHHLFTRKASPELENEPYNKIPLSRQCHIECHALGLTHFANKYSKVKQWLDLHEWTFCPITMKWTNFELRNKQIQLHNNKL
jgi:hypothetical protein